MFRHLASHSTRPGHGHCAALCRCRCGGGCGRGIGGIGGGRRRANDVAHVSVRTSVRAHLSRSRRRHPRTRTRTRTQTQTYAVQCRLQCRQICTSRMQESERAQTPHLMHDTCHADATFERVHLQYTDTVTSQCVWVCLQQANYKCVCVCVCAFGTVCTCGRAGAVTPREHTMHDSWRKCGVDFCRCILLFSRPINIGRVLARIRWRHVRNYVRFRDSFQLCLCMCGLLSQ